MEKLKLIDKANVLHAACILFGHEELGKEKFIEIVARIAEEIEAPLLGEKSKPAASNQPAAWSEDDENTKKEIKSFFQCAAFERYIPNPAWDDWLDALSTRITWKPSEEQMEALKWQVENTAEGSWQYRDTESLYNDLKKL